MDKNKSIESAAKLIAKGAFDKAVKEYQRVLELDPDDVRILQKLAELYQKMNRKAEAADCFEKAGDTKASLDTLKKLVDLDPDNVAARIRLGEQYTRQDNLIEAVAELRRAAQYLQRNGRQDDYLRVAERISHLDQADVGLAKELAEQYLSRGDSKRALAKLQICFKANPRELSTLQMLAKAFQDLGQVTKTVSVLKELARVHLDGGRKDEAHRILTQALELAPDDAEVKASLKGVAGAAGSRPRAPEPVRPPPRPAPAPAAKAAPVPPPPRPAPAPART